MVFGDTAYAGHVSAGEWQAIVDAMTPPLRSGDVRLAFTAGLDALEALLVEKGFRDDGAPRNGLPDRPLEPKADDE